MSIAHAARPFRRLLEYVPDDVILEAASRDFEMSDGEKCLAGWVLRGVLARIVDAATESVDLGEEGETLEYNEDYNENIAGPVDPPEMLSAFVGGRESTWAKLFNGVMRVEGATNFMGVPYQVTLPVIEYAFARRVAEAVERTRGH